MGLRITLGGWISAVSLDMGLDDDDGLWNDRLLYIFVLTAYCSECMLSVYYHELMIMSS